MLSAANKGGALRFIYTNVANNKKVISIFKVTYQNEPWRKKN